MISRFSATGGVNGEVRPSAELRCFSIDERNVGLEHDDRDIYGNLFV